MKKYLTLLVAVLAVAAVALPAYAFEVTWGGVFRARVMSDNFFTSSDNPNIPSSVGANPNISPYYFSYSPKISDHYNRVDQRERLYMYVTASENLRIVTRYEIGDITWGNTASGGEVHADQDIIELKNAFIEFNIPQTPLRATVGVQGIALLNSWLVDNDFSAAVLTADLKPVKVTFGYIGAQNENAWTSNDNVDSLFMKADYNSGPFGATVVGYYQDGHNTVASVDPKNNSSIVPLANVNGNYPGDATSSGSFLPAGMTAKNNTLFDLGMNLNYKLDWMNAYMNFIKNFGGVDLYDGATKYSDDYQGWMIDGGTNLFYGPYTITLRGFYTSGADIEKNPASPYYGRMDPNGNLKFFASPYGATSQYSSELMGGGILDNSAPYHENYQWTAYNGVSSNLWTVSLGAAWQALPTTKLSASYWYFGNPKDVVSGYNSTTGNLQFGNTVGHEFDFYLTQDIVDGLKLDLVAAYMISGNAYSQYNNDPNPYELGARIQWAF